MKVSILAKLITTITLLLLAACARKPIQQRPIAGPQARVRIDNGIPIALYPGAYCYKSNKKSDPEPYTSASRYFVGNKVVDSKSVTLGMPVTSATPKFFNEYFVEADRPSIVSVTDSTYSVMGAMAYIGTCGPIYVSFTPREGRDYEVIGVTKTLGPRNQRVCAAEINEIVRGDDGSYRLKPILPMPAPPCSATDHK